MKQKIIYILSSLLVLASPLATLAVDSKLLNPLGTDKPEILIGTIIKAFLGLSGSVALLVFVYGGFMYLISAGDPKRLEKGKDTIKNGALGLAIIFLSYIMVTTVIAALTKGDVINVAPQSPGSNPVYNCKPGETPIVGPGPDFILSCNP